MKVWLSICLAVWFFTGHAVASGTKRGNDYKAIVTFGGGNGSSFEQAIIIHAPDQVSGFPSEFAFIKMHFADYPYVRKEQREKRNNKVYDVVTLAAYDWRQRVVYFDITE